MLSIIRMEQKKVEGVLLIVSLRYFLEVFVHKMGRIEMFNLLVQCVNWIYL